jgi:uncharacterized protein (TIGR02594 family)
MNIISKALSEYGVKETVGSKDNLRILKYFNETGFDGSKLKDEYSGQLTARSWLRVGTSTHTPKVGDIVVLWRESPQNWKGHVGFFIKETKNYVYVLGGNQRNMVCIKAYPKPRVLDYRQLAHIK